jgi:hypothetical protein
MTRRSTLTSAKVTRRQAIGVCSGMLIGAPAVLSTPVPNDIQVSEIHTSYEDFLYRTPIKFGGSVVDKVTLLNVRCVVRGRNGKTAAGFGSMSMGNVWSFPSKKLSYAETLQAMKDLAARIGKITTDYREWGHPIDVNVALEPAYLGAAAEISKGLSEPIPPLCTLVTASPFDAAIHDAYGKLHGRNCFQTLTPEFLPRDLSHYLGPDFRGERLEKYVLPKAQAELPLYHLVGAVDPITPEDVKKPVGDGLPEALGEWIR